LNSSTFGLEDSSLQLKSRKVVIKMVKTTFGLTLIPLSFW